jgi:hypothetical protein
MVGKPLDYFRKMPTIAVGGFLFPEESQSAGLVPAFLFMGAWCNGNISGLHPDDEGSTPFAVHQFYGEMAERLKAAVLKTEDAERRPWVRILLSPPYMLG